MTPLPSDLASARELVEAWIARIALYRPAPILWEHERVTLAAAIATAFTALREECARIVDNATQGDNLLHSCSEMTSNFEHGELHGKRIRYDIAAAIRAPRPSRGETQEGT